MVLVTHNYFFNVKMTKLLVENLSKRKKQFLIDNGF